MVSNFPRIVDPPPISHPDRHQDCFRFDSMPLPTCFSVGQTHFCDEKLFMIAKFSIQLEKFVANCCSMSVQLTLSFTQFDSDGIFAPYGHPENKPESEPVAPFREF